MQRKKRQILYNKYQRAYLIKFPDIKVEETNVNGEPCVW